MRSSRCFCIQMLGALVAMLGSFLGLYLGGLVAKRAMDGGTWPSFVLSQFKAIVVLSTDLVDVTTKHANGA